MVSSARREDKAIRKVKVRQFCNLEAKINPLLLESYMCSDFRNFIPSIFKLFKCFIAQTLACICNFQVTRNDDTRCSLQWEILQFFNR